MRQLLALAAILACTPAPAPEKPAPAKPAEPEPVPVDCAGRVAAMRALFAHRPDSPIVINIRPDVALPTTDRGEPIADGIPLFTFADGSFELDARPLPSVDAAHEALTEQFELAQTLAERQGQPFEPRLLLVADARTPAAALRELAGRLPPGTRYALIADVAGDTVPPPPPTPEPVREALAAPPAERSQKLADLLTPAVGSCTALQKVFEAIAATTADKRDDVLFDGLPTAVETCRCQGIDLDTLVAVTWAMSGKTSPDRRALSLPLTADPKAEAVKLPATATVADLVPLAGPGKPPFRLVQ